MKYVGSCGSRQFDTENRASMRNVISGAGEKLVHLSNPSRKLSRIGRIKYRNSAEHFLFEMLHAMLVNAGKGSGGGWWGRCGRGCGGLLGIGSGWWWGRCGRGCGGVLGVGSGVGGSGI